MGQDVSLSAASVDCLPDEHEVHFGEDFFGRVEASVPRVLGPHFDDGTNQVMENQASTVAQQLLWQCCAASLISASMPLEYKTSMLMR